MKVLIKLRNQKKKKRKKDPFVYKYELFKVSDNKIISKMFLIFTYILDSLTVLDKDIGQHRVGEQYPTLTSKELEIKGDRHIASKRVKTLKLEQLIGLLNRHEMFTSTNEKKQKKDLALKVSTSNDDGDDDEDEEVALLSLKFKWFLIQRKEGLNKAFKKDSNDVMKCYECRKLVT